MKKTPRPRAVVPNPGGEPFGVIDLGEPVYKIPMPPETDAPVRVVSGSKSGALKLTLEPRSDADPVELALGLVDLLLAIDRLDQNLSGRGFVRKRHARRGSSLTLTLVPHWTPGAEYRARVIADVVNQGVSIPTPPAVERLTARVA